MALKEEKVLVTSGKKKTSVRKETHAVSGMRVTIVHKNQNTMPPHLLSIIRLMNNQNKKPQKGYYFHKRRESDDKNAMVIVKIVPQMGCVSQDSDALVSQRGKQPR